MNEVHFAILVLHVVIGMAAILLFWAPAFTKKGSPSHVRFGRYYVNSMYAVSATGMLMALLVFIDPLAIHGDILRRIPDPDVRAEAIRSFWSLLFYLGILTLASTRHGVLVLRSKAHRRELRQVPHLGLLGALTLGGPVMFVWGYQSNAMLMMIFGGLGTLAGSGMLRYCFKAHLTRMEWWIEHLGAMIGSGIAAYTAFFSFGMRRLLSSYPDLQLLGWILPGVIGVTISVWLTRKYRLKLSPN